MSRPEVALREIAKQPPTPPPLPQDLAQLEATVEGWNTATPEERAAYGRWFLVALEANRAQMHHALRARSDARHHAVSLWLSRIFMVLIGCSFLLLLLPLIYWRRYKGRRRRFTAYCLLAAVLLAFTFFVFQVLVVGVARASSGIVGAVNPQQPMLDAALDHAETHLETWIQPPGEGGVPLGPTMDDMRDPGEGDFVSRFVDNLRYLDLEALTRVAQATQVVYVLLGFGPNVGALLITVVFLLTMGFVFRALLVLPFRGAEGETRAGRAATKLALRSLWRELLAVMVFTFSLTIPSVCLHFSVRYMAYGLFDGMMEQTVSLVDYTGRLTSAPAETQLTLGMLALPVMLLIIVGVFLASVVGYTVWARRITQLRFHRGVRFKEHGGFFRSAWARVFRIQWALALVMFFGIPAVVALTGRPPHESMGAALGTITWRAALAVVLLIAAVLLFQVIRDLWWFVRFRPVQHPTPPAESLPADEEPEAGVVDDGDAPPVA